MFELPIDDRLSAWAQLRSKIETCKNPLKTVNDFWKSAPFIPYNNKIDPYFQFSWPTPWELIVENKYDDFTKSLMIGWTLKLTKKFQDSKIEIKTLLDKNKSMQYNVVYIDDAWVMNYSDNGPILTEDLPEGFLLENLIELDIPR